MYVCISAEAVHTPLTSVSGFLAMSTGLSVSNRGAVVRQLVGRPAGRKPAHTSPGMYTDNICTNSRQQMIPRDDQNSIHYKNTTISAGMTSSIKQVMEQNCIEALNLVIIIIIITISIITDPQWL